MLEWMKNNPETVAFAITLFAAIFNWITKPRTPEELAKYPPRVSAFFRAMNALFPDPEKLTEAIWQAWNNTHSRLPYKTGNTLPPPKMEDSDKG